MFLNFDTIQMYHNSEKVQTYLKVEKKNPDVPEF
jgi:hypothetical protein